MIGWIQNLNDDSRRTSLIQASLKSGISPKALEKDWWGTLVLKLLFTSQYSDYFSFKGGTSLSKAWGIIDRFSEDIDIALDSKVFGRSQIANPSKTFVEQLRRLGSKFTRNEIADELRAKLVKCQIPKDLFFIEVEALRPDRPDTDPQTIYLNYKSLFDPNPYLPDKVKIEFSVRSQTEPSAMRTLQTLLQTYFPNEIYEEESFKVFTTLPERTLIEKVLLLHEEFNQKDKSKARTHRMSRHYYDLFRICQKEEFSRILTDIQFIEEVIQHRRFYSRLRHFNYDSLCVGRIAIVPSEAILAAINKDYNEMSAEMMFGRVPTFPEIMEEVKRIEDIFNQKG